MKILLVDDDAFLRDMYATKFGEEGHAVDVAKTGEEALEMMRAENYDVVLLDMVMPGISGVEFLEKVQKEKIAETTACIVLSNQGEQEDIDNAMRAGAKGYIVKAEMVPSEVVERVNAICA